MTVAIWTTEVDPDVVEVEDGLGGTDSDPEEGPYQRGHHPDHHYHEDEEDKDVASVKHLYWIFMSFYARLI